MELRGLLRAPSVLFSGKELSGAYCIESWVGSIAGLDTVIKEKNLCLYRESIIQLVVQRFSAGVPRGVEENDYVIKYAI
jgi:hypothetical protein